MKIIKTMESQRLIKMLNQISTNLSPHRSDEDAAELVKTHITKFWSKTMRDQILSVPSDTPDLSNRSKIAIKNLKELNIH